MGTFCKNGSCICPDSMYFNGSNCVLEKASCDLNNSCNINMGLTCQNGFCYCPDSMYLNGSICIRQKAESNTCLTNIECNANLGLTCTQNSCQCDALNSFWNNTTCGNINYLNFFQICIIINKNLSIFKLLK